MSIDDSNIIILYLNVLKKQYRIQKELAEITLDPPPNCRYHLKI